jgi:hypothetical protein
MAGAIRMASAIRMAVPIPVPAGLGGFGDLSSLERNFDPFRDRDR